MYKDTDKVYPPTSLLWNTNQKRSRPKSPPSHYYSPSESQSPPRPCQWRSKQTINPKSSNPSQGRNIDTFNQIQNYVAAPKSKKRWSPPPSTHFERTVDLDPEDEEARARRLARFKGELEPIQAITEDQRFRVSSPPRREAVDETMDIDEAQPILGTCPDMCPESERGERERKGDLDKFERLDGDRNVTHKSLAVKKYNRVADRNASLIRPLLVLQKTIDHLLNIINCSYVEDFLSMYNFLWDRMRAIRMDLRMQHIFDKEAIRMYEQMIRFHIVAMHELCEYTKGEGFSEGFDAHLNIEQMNKTSVELFEMYDDHRKRGCPIPTEPEFRGYYALLKLDKHPGYMVEAAELSLDLAKMTPEMRNKDEVLFAREVARASRSGNFVSFFRLARKATYLQACLMHAHFSKLRTQALSSLHSGLQKNQGIPVAQVVRWLAMEGEDIESLLEYHGFTIKNYEKPYMMKEGPFLNSDNPFPTKISKLVHEKRSAKVVDDVGSPPRAPILDDKRLSTRPLDVRKGKDIVHTKFELKDSAVANRDEPADVKENKKFTNIDKSEPFQFHRDTGSYRTPAMQETGNLPPLFSVQKPMTLPYHNEAHVNHFAPTVETKNESIDIAADIGKIKEKSSLLEEEDDSLPVALVKNDTSLVEDPVEKIARLSTWKVEAKNARLRLLLRKWKHWAATRAQNRISDRLKADAALSRLLAGPALRFRKMSDQREDTGGLTTYHTPLVNFNIDDFLRQRQKRHKEMWSSLNVPEIVTPVLLQKNPQGKCLCWKLVICSEDEHTGAKSQGFKSLARQWLHRKLMGDAKLDGEISSPLTVILKRWFTAHNQDNGIHSVLALYILSIVDLNLHNIQSKENRLTGASGVIYLTLNASSWDYEQARLNVLVESVESGAKIPLLIVTYENIDASTVEHKLGLQSLDKSKISSWLIVGVGESLFNVLEGTSDDSLRHGLLWLAEHGPSKPKVFPSHIRDLVLESLSPFLKLFLSLKSSEVTPNDCVHAFNEAIERTEEDIVSSARNSLPGWPPPEVMSIEDSLEAEAVRSALPKSGWNSNSNINSLVNALRMCRLPQFPMINLHPISVGPEMQRYNPSASHSERRFLDEVKTQTKAFQECLCQYLSQISTSREDDLMIIKEADLMIQHSTGFEWVDSRYLIIPRWAQIFQRIYFWRLMLLDGAPEKIAYTLRPRAIPKVEIAKKVSDARQAFMSSSTAPPVEPTFSEMLQAVSSSTFSGLGPLRRKAVDQKGSKTKSLVSHHTFGPMQDAPLPLPPLQSKSTVDVSILRKENHRNFNMGSSHEVSQYTVVRRTPRECQLDGMVDNFCKKVNQQSKRTALTLEGVDDIDYQSPLSLQGRVPSFTRNLDVEAEISRISTSQNGNSQRNGGCILAIPRPSVANDNTKESLDSLYEQCLCVQRTIDDKLAWCLRQAKNSQHTEA